MTAFEANFDGLVGPTHNYAGLSFGNVASTGNQAAVSNPKLAALQGLKKMKALHDMGLVQGVFAPQERPDTHTLRQLGFTGSDAQVLERANKSSPKLLAACCSASSMWTANAATVSPSANTADSKVHFTPANLSSKFHRAIEHETTGRILQAMFPDSQHFAHHKALPGVSHFGDEGAANHTRFCSEPGKQGVEFFVYGRKAFSAGVEPQKYPARQTLEASQAIARNHQLDNGHVVYAQQNPAVIDQGVFHNDVIAVGSRDVLFCHEQAYLDQQQVYADLKAASGWRNFQIVEVPSNRVSVSEAVKSYLFNSQLITLPDGSLTIIVPAECQDNENVWSYLQELVTGDSPINAVKAFDLRQSMNNGGGPACLRLRVEMNDKELKAANQSCILDDGLYTTLCNWVERHYRDQLHTDDLIDPQLLEESRRALDELTGILGLGAVYPFQRV
ncbi:N-succinylarginine dihydrolase [Spongorhabdus nitratireducens]